MRINQVNQQQQNQKNIQAVESKEIDLKMQSTQQVKIKVHDDNDKLEMLGDSQKRKETFETMQEFVNKKEKIYNIDMSKSFIDRHFLLMNNIKSIISDSTKDTSFESRVNNQEKIDGFTKDLKSLSMNIHSKMKTKKFDPEELGLKGVLSLAQMGKVTVRTRSGKNERILVYYTSGTENKTIKIDLDKNTGDLTMGFGEKHKEVTNKVVKELLEEKGYQVNVKKSDLNGNFIEGLNKFNLNESPNLLVDREKEDAIISNKFNDIDNKLKINFNKSEEIVGLSVMTQEDASKSLDKIENALGFAKEAKSKIMDIEDKLDIGSDKIYDIFFGDRNVRNINDAIEKMKEIKVNLFKENNFMKYLENIQDPALVYKLLK